MCWVHLYYVSEVSIRFFEISIDWNELFAILTLCYCKRFTYKRVLLNFVLMTFMYDVHDLPSVPTFLI
jgi:hypothetical protein